MYDLEEQEKLDALKRFWAQWGNMIVTAAIAAAVAVAAVQGWAYYKRSQSEQASALFSVFEEAVRKGDVAAIRESGGKIIDDFGSTAYGPMAALALARFNYDSGEPETAATQLQWVIDKAKDDDSIALARLRLAGIRLDDKKYDEALKLLDGEHGAALASLYADLRGDVLLAQGKTEEARSAYRTALEKSLPNSSYRNVVQIKLDALGPGQ
jgi:predicted negative regulator of RcsB-dependent stress response